MIPRTGRAQLAAALAAIRAGGGRVLGERVEGDGALPLSEGANVALATGLALAGTPVVVELVDLAGVVRAADALADAGDVAARSGGAWSAPVVVLAPLAADAAIPPVPAGVGRVVVGRASDVAHAVEAATRASGPTVVLLADDALEGRGVPEATGEAVVLREGDAASLLAVGAGVAVALAAAEALEADGLRAEVVDLRGPTPDAVALRSVARTGRPVVVGHGGVEMAALVSGAFWRLESEPRFVPATAGVGAVVAAVREALEA